MLVKLLQTLKLAAINFTLCVIFFTHGAVAYSAELSKASVCAQTLQTTREAKSDNSEETYREIFAAMFAKRKYSLTHRGFLGSFPAETPTASEVAEEFGIFSWGLRIFIKPSFAEAQKHAQQELFVNKEGGSQKDSIFSGLYFIADLAKGDDFSSAKFDLQKVVRSGAYFFPNPDNTSEYSFIPHEQLSEILNDTNDEPVWRSDARMGKMIVIHGWAFPQKRGFAHIPHSLSGKAYSNSYAFIRKFFQDIYKKTARGQDQLILRKQFHITFNEAPIATLEALKYQVRDKQELEQNRYYDPRDPEKSSESYKAMKGRLERGTAVTVEIWHTESKTLAAGLIATRNGNAYSPDSVHYKREIDVLRVRDNETDKAKSYEVVAEKVKGIEFARIAAYAFFERLLRLGIDGQDIQMVSPYSKMIHGVYISDEEYLAWRNKLPKNIITLPNENWQPKEHLGSSTNEEP